MIGKGRAAAGPAGRRLDRPLLSQFGGGAARIAPWRGPACRTMPRRGRSGNRGV